MHGSHVDHSSPIEDQVIEVYQNAKRFALANGFKKHVHNGPYGPVSGLKGPMVLKRLCRQLFPGYSEHDFDTAYSIINQALRKTDACVCLNRGNPKPANGSDEPRVLPEWFVRDEMPGNLIVVTLAQAKKSADVTERPTAFDEDRYLTPREKRLLQSEVERPAGEVTVTKTTTTTETTVTRTPEERIAPLREHHEQRRQEHKELVERVLLEIQTQPVPVTVRELETIINRDDKTDWEVTTIRSVLKELEEAGRVVKRVETQDEARVRGGGQLPKATRPFLFASAPGSVPTRTRLPDGIDTLRSAQDYAAEVTQRLLDEEETVMTVLRMPGENAKNPPRYLGDLEHLTEFDRAQLRAILERLKGKGLVRERNHRYYPSDARSAKKTPEEVTVSLPSDKPEVTVQTATPQPDPDTVSDQGENEQIVLSLAAKLGVQLPTGDAFRIAELEQENNTLHGENERLRNQVAALKAAIAALT